MTTRGTLELIFDELLLALRPIGSVLRSPEDFQRFLEQRGFSYNSPSLAPVVTALGPTRSKLLELVEEGGELAAEYEAGTADAADYLEFGQKLLEFIVSARDLPDQLATLGRALPPTFAGEIFDVLLASYFASSHPVVYRVFLLFGFIEQRTIEPASGDPLARDIGYVHIAVRYDRIGTLFRQPDQLARDVYGWNTSNFNSDLLLMRVQQVFAAFGFVARIDEMRDEAIARLYASAAARDLLPKQLSLPVYEDIVAGASIEAGVVLMPVEGGTATDAGIALMPYADGSVTAEVDITDTVSLTLAGQAAFQGGFAFAVRPSGLTFEAGIFATTPAPEIRVELAKNPPDGQSSIVLLGSPDPGSRLECDRMLLAVGGNPQDFYIAGGLLQLRAVVAPSNDGLLGTLLPNGLLIEAGDILIGWRPSRGVYFEKGAALRVVIPVNLTVGPIRIPELEGRLAFDPDITIGIGVSAEISIGPLFLAAYGLGIAVKVVPKPRGKFGGFDLEPGLLLPTGYAASLQGGPISGGGAIFVEETGYKGALALRFASFSLSAFAVLTTKMPSGAPGFSFLATIFAEFEIQLGFGFKLTGVGGLVGVHRVTNVEALRGILKAGNVDGLLFPPNPIQDAARILRDMEAAFPVQQGTHVFGPMARIAWGTPTLIEAKVGVIIELGNSVRIVILGQIRVVLPTKEAAVLVLSIDFLGIIDFGARTIALDATLQNSRILEWPITGESALRTGWHRNADFIFSVGGFHPEFPTPANFPSLQRLTINFGSDNPRITLTAYFAITLNTFQIGARLELFLRGPDIWAVGKFDVDGLAYFDALLQFNPFAFDVALGLALSLLRDGDVLCSIGGDIRLRGPNPYHIHGRVWAEVCRVKVSVSVNRTFGDARRDEIEVADALAIFTAAVALPDNWEPVMPSRHVSGVTLAPPAVTAGSTILVDPVAGMRFSQRAIPLGVRIEKLGTARLANDYRTFDVRAIDAAGATLQTTDVRSPFTTSQYFDLSEDEQFRAPPSEEYRSGVELAATDELQYIAAAAVPMSYDYETVPLLGDDDDDTDALAETYAVPAARAHSWASSGIHRVSMPRNFAYQNAALLTDSITVASDRYVVASAQATAAGVVAAKSPDGAPLVGTYGEMRAMAAGRPIVASYLADPSSIEED